MSERAASNRVVCRHCGKTRFHRCRGLCATCYKLPGVRDRYEPLGPHGRAGARGRREEPTEAELDAVIAEQRKRLPPWWNEDATQDPRDERPRVVRLLRKNRK